MAQGLLKGGRCLGLPYLFLFLACLYFCHRLYGIYFPFDPDVAQNLYFVFHKNLIEADHNPFQGYYSNYLPVSRAYNPVVSLSSFFVGLTGLSRVEKAVAINMTAGVICLWLAAVSSYSLFRYCGKSRMGSLLGAVITSFTGYPGAFGVRQFDFFYLLSFMAIGPAIICFDRIVTTVLPGRWVVLGSMVIGLSLLGGTNVPLFFFLPLALIFFASRKSGARSVLKNLGWLALTLILGVASAAAVLVPGIVYLGETNRATLVFHDPAFDTTPLQQLWAVLFRDWWGVTDIPGSAIDFFLGFPVLIFFLFGVSKLFEKRRQLISPSDPFPRFWLICFVAGLVTINFCYLPDLVRFLLERSSALFSIRFPHRFFPLILFPVGYFAAGGLETKLTRRKSAILLGLVLGYLFLVWKVVVPHWPTLIPDLRFAFLGSQFFALFTVIAFAVMGGGKRGEVVVTSTFFMFLLAPLQLTTFSNFIYEEQRLEKNRKIGLYYEGRFSYREFFGLTENYSSVIHRVRELLTQPPSDLRAIETRRGRILEDLPGNKKSPSYYAPVTGHRFMFTNLEDPATPRKIRELAAIRTDAILDMAGVCWEENRHIYRERKNCFPSAFLVPRALPFSDDILALKWLARATHEDLATDVALDCQTEDCRFFGAGSSELSQHHLSAIREEPGSFEFNVNLDQPAFLFLSTPYRFDWRARVNGKGRKIFRANHAFMAIPVPDGASRITLTLDNGVTQYSRLFTLLVFLILGGWGLFELRKHRLPRMINVSPMEELA